jgi:hypothetical protein
LALSIRFALGEAAIGNERKEKNDVTALLEQLVFQLGVVSLVRIHFPDVFKPRELGL